MWENECIVSIFYMHNYARELADAEEGEIQGL